MEAYNPSKFVQLRPDIYLLDLLPVLFKNLKYLVGRLGWSRQLVNSREIELQSRVDRRQLSATPLAIRS
jgi:hypothetical protein